MYLYINNKYSLKYKHKPVFGDVFFHDLSVYFLAVEPTTLLSSYDERAQTARTYKPKNNTLVLFITFFG